MRVVELHVNGTSHRLEVDAERSLLSVLRDELDLTGTKYGCGEGRCGACTVLVDGRAVRSCLLLAQAVAGKPITTIEGLAQQGQLQQHPHPTEADILGAMQGHICRCGTYPRIVAAIQRAANHAW